MPSFGTTGRSLVLLAENAAAEGGRAVPEALAGQPVVQVFPLLGVAVVDAPPDALAAAEAAPAVLAVEHERLVAAFDLSPEYLRGYRDAVEHLAGIGAAQAEPPSEESATWGMQAVRAPESSFSGAGVRVAVLDTGFDATHPDFAGRDPVLKSFVEGQEPADGNGHGTHCIGTALGPLAPETGPRYGLAYRGEIYAGKVLSNAGSGSDTEILAGMEWSLEQSCAVVSMSLGAPVDQGEAYSQVFEAAARRMQDAGTLIVAAAGNESNRPVSIQPVGHPANCPSILAVAALDSSLGVASFSNRGINLDGGQIDIAGPGVDVYSSWPMPARYRRLSGTSMATPHAAGVAALLAEANPEARGAALARLLVATARRLDAPSSDVGAGIVQAP
jgi:subtilisin family serine protease